MSRHIFENVGEFQRSLEPPGDQNCHYIDITNQPNCAMHMAEHILHRYSVDFHLVVFLALAKVDIFNKNMLKIIIEKNLNMHFFQLVSSSAMFSVFSSPKAGMFRTQTPLIGSCLDSGSASWPSLPPGHSGLTH